MSDAADIVRLAAREIWAAKAEGAAEERARIVTMLRTEATAMLRHDAQALVLGLANRIERGEA